MAVRIIRTSIPGHWEYAKRNRFWDLLRNSTLLASGDTAYFWATREAQFFTGRAQLTSDPYDLPLGSPHRWSPDDPGKGLYRRRVDLTSLKDIAQRDVSWREVVSGTGLRDHQGPVLEVPAAGAAWLEEALGVRWSASRSGTDTQYSGVTTLELTDLDPSRVTLTSLRDRNAVLMAIREFDALGREAFLQKYGFGRSRQYLLVHDGGRYDSKAIAGAALAFQAGVGRPLPAQRFSGGTDGAVGRLRQLGFTVVTIDPNFTTDEGMSAASGDPAIASAIEVVDRAISRDSGQGYGLSAAERRAIEMRAVEVTTTYLESETGGHWTVRDVGSTHSYDLHATRGAETLYVEVKGTTTAGAEVLLTRNEVELHRAMHFHNMLAIVTGITLDRRGEAPSATGGDLEVTSPWRIADESLVPLAYRYTRDQSGSKS